VITVDDDTPTQNNTLVAGTVDEDGVIENVVTDAAHRRRGFAAVSMRALLSRCWEAGCYKVMLSSGSKRAEVHAFYESLGFDRHAKQSFVITPSADAGTTW